MSTHKPDTPKQIENAKNTYLNLQASDALRSRVMSNFTNQISDMEAGSYKKMENKKIKKRRPLWQSVAATAAALVLTFSVGLNLSPAFADAVATLPGLEGVVKVLTFGRYALKDSGYEVTIETPQIEGLLNKELQDKLNTEFQQYADALILGVEADIKQLKEDFPGETVHFGLDSGYQILTDNDQYLVIDVYLVNTVGSSNTLHNFYTIDKVSQKQVTLKQFLLATANPAQVTEQEAISKSLANIEAYILKEMRRQMDANESVYWLEDPGMMPEPLVTENSLFYINTDNQLVIAFEKYSVAPGAEGTPTFVIPEDVIMPNL